MLNHPKLIVLVVLDSARADHMSCYGYHKNTTPFLASLFKQASVLFENAVSTGSWTLPATASILTGVLPSCHGRFHPLRGPWVNRVPQLSSILQTAGFYTELITANNFFIRERYGFTEGFQKATSIETVLDYDRKRRYLRLLLTRHGRGLDQGGSAVVDAFTQSVSFHRNVLSFYYLHFMDTHGSFNVPLEYVERVTGRRLNWRELSRLGNADEKLRAAIQRYDGAVLYTDGLLERLVGYLQENGLWEDTLLIITADHGEGFGGYQGFRGHGTRLYRPLIHVPLVLVSPQIFQTMRCIPNIVQTMDIVPTILDCLGMKWDPQLPERTYGTSLLGLLRSHEQMVERIALSEEWGAGPLREEPERWLCSATDGNCHVIVEDEQPPEIFEWRINGQHEPYLWKQEHSPKPRQLLQEIEYLRTIETKMQEKMQVEELGEEEVLSRLRDLGYVD